MLDSQIQIVARRHTNANIEYFHNLGVVVEIRRQDVPVLFLNHSLLRVATKHQETDLLRCCTMSYVLPQREMQRTSTVKGTVPFSRERQAV